MHDTIEHIEELEDIIFNLMSIEVDIENGNQQGALQRANQVIKNLTAKRKFLAIELAKFEAEVG